MSPRRTLPPLLAAALIASAGVAPAAGQQAREVVDVRFAGAESFTARELSSAIVTAPTRCTSLFVCWAGVGLERSYLSPAALDADALRLRVYYYERGYRNAEISVDTTTHRQGVRVSFRIREGRPVRVSSVRLRDAPPGIGDRPLPLVPGRPLDVVAYEASRDTLLTRLRNSGYAHAQVLLSTTIPQENPQSAVVEYEVYPGPLTRVGPISVEGTQEASPDLVRRMLVFREGDLYDRSALLESQRNLYRLQIFRNAEVRAQLGAGTDSVVPVTVQVAEGDLRRVRIGGGVNTVDCGNVEGRWTSRNFMGGGRRLELRGRLGNLQCGWVPEDVRGEFGAAYDSLTGLLSLEFTQPWFFGPRNNIGVGMFAERRSVPEVFVRSAVGGHLAVGRSIGRGAGITLAYRPELTELRTEGDLFFCVSFVACAYEDRDVLGDPHWLSPISLSMTVDRSNGIFTPSTGYVARAEVEHAAPYTASDFAYTRVLGEGSTYFGQSGGMVLATRLRGGIAWPHRSGEVATLRLNPQKRFFAGGPNSVRGLGQYRLGPTVLGVDAVQWLARPVEERGAGCSAAAINDSSCDPGGLPAGAFTARPAGGEVLLEGNVELRFPLPIPGGKFRGAAFLDAGQVWATARDVSLRDLVATPGIGVRYYSPVGPIRMDAGFNTSGAMTLPVLTTRVEGCVRAADPGCEASDVEPRDWLRNTDEIVILDHRVVYDPYRPLDSLAGFLQRFQLHFSIGQAF